MLEILFIRHGQTDWNAELKLMGCQPIPLNRVGRTQAGKLADYLKGVKLDAVVSSALKRACETAGFLLKDRPELKLIVDEGLNEIDFGEWVNLHIDDITTRHAALWHDYHHKPETFKVPGGETLIAAQARAVNAVLKIGCEYPNGRIAIVSHADIIKLALVGLLGWPLKYFSYFSIDNCSMIILRQNPESGSGTLGMCMILYNPFNDFGKDM